MSSFDILGPGGLQPAPTLPGRIDEQPLSIDGESAESTGFAEYLSDALHGVKSLQDDVKAKADALARGEPVELHDLMISMGKSEVAFNLMLEVRNKLLDAWQTLSRSSV